MMFVWLIVFEITWKFRSLQILAISETLVSMMPQQIEDYVKESVSIFFLIKFCDILMYEELPG